MAGPVGCGNIQHLLHRRVNTTVEFGAESYCTIVSIEWMKDDEKVCDWSGGSVKCYGKYKYAAKVDVLTGGLTGQPTVDGGQAQHSAGKRR